MIKDALVKKILDFLLNYFASNLASVVLYGSYAKDMETPYSDIDILIIVNRGYADWREKRKVEVSLRRETLLMGQISPKIMTTKELLSSVENYNPLVLNIVSNGKSLYDTGIFKKARKQFKDLYGKKIIKTVAGYWEIAV